MKRLATQLTLVFAAIAAAPAALAGSEVLKCVDGAGHVTLTDQPCESGSRVTRLVNGSEPDGPATAAASEAPAASAQRHEPSPALVRQHAWRPRVENRDRPLARDVATLKAARAQLLLIDADRAHRPTLAGIQ